MLCEEVMIMQKWCTEDWQFELTAIEGKAGTVGLDWKKEINLSFHMNVLPECVLKQ